MPDDYKAGKGRTLLIPSGTANDPNRKHLFVTLTNGCANNQHLLVSCCTLRENGSHDPSCVVEAGAHPFIKARSFVLYARPAHLHGVGITKCVGLANYIPREDCEQALLEKICEGLLASPMTPRWAKAYFDSNRNR